MKLRPAILGICISTCFWGCLPKPLPIEVDQVEPQIVVSSQVIPNQVMVITLSRSFSALEQGQDSDSLSEEFLNQLLVENATVTISYEGVTDTLFDLPDVPGVYASVSTPQYDHVAYTLSAYDPQTGSTVSSTEEMLPFVGFDSVAAVRGSSNGFDYIDVSYSFTDPPGSNWYMVNYYAEPEENIQFDPLSPDQNIANFTQLLNDKTFGTFEFSDTYRIYDWDSTNVYVSISNISENYYNYLALRSKSENFFTDLVKEPINYPTNIENGLGYFTTHHPDVRFIQLD